MTTRLQSRNGPRTVGATPCRTGFSLPVQWPNGQLMHLRACPTHGYDLCYSAQPGESVNLFTARDGLRVKMCRGGEEGVLVQPKEVSPASGGGVVWLVDFSAGGRDGLKLTYLMTRLYAEPTFHATEEYEDASELEVRASVIGPDSGEHRLRPTHGSHARLCRAWWVEVVILPGSCWGLLGNRNAYMTVTRLLGCNYLVALGLHIASGWPPKTLYLLSWLPQ